jgi:CheY-like chemotaxis protein
MTTFEQQDWSAKENWKKRVPQGGLAPKDRQIQRFDYRNARCTRFGSTLTISGERNAPRWLLTQFRKVKVHTLGQRIGGQSRDGIWLLDDDVSMLKALGRLMNSAGFIVEKFNDPATFVAKLQHAPCRVAVLDVWMPQMNGLEVQACLRRDSPETRIIFISGRDDPLVRQNALDAGAVAFLAKPFDDENLVRLVREAQAAAAT